MKNMQYTEDSIIIILSFSKAINKYKVFFFFFFFFFFLKKRIYRYNIVSFKRIKVFFYHNLI